MKIENPAHANAVRGENRGADIKNNHDMSLIKVWRLWSKIFGIAQPPAINTEIKDIWTDGI